ncbi:MAG: methylmalonyl-CoA mutase family protein, partial [Halobacteriaceae archaeon]
NELIVVGVNRFEADEEPEIDIEEVSEEDEQAKIDQLNKIKQQRDDEAVAAKLASLREAAQGDANLMPHIIDAVKAYATVGEICNELRDVFGEYQPGSAM